MRKVNPKTVEKVLVALKDMKKTLKQDPKGSLFKVCAHHKVNRIIPNALKEFDVIIKDENNGGYVWVGVAPTQVLSKRILEYSNNKSKLAKARSIDEKQNSITKRIEMPDPNNSGLDVCLAILEVLYKEHAKKGFNLLAFCKRYKLEDVIRQRISNNLIKNEGVGKKFKYVWIAGDVDLKLAFQMFKRTKFLENKAASAQTVIQYKLPFENTSSSPASKNEIKTVLEAQTYTNPKEKYLFALVKLAKLTEAFTKVNLFKFCRENGINDSSRIKLGQKKIIIKNGTSYKWNTSFPTMAMVDIHFSGIKEIREFNEKNDTKKATTDIAETNVEIVKKESAELIKRKSVELPKLIKVNQAKLAKLELYEKAEREGAKPGRETAINDIAEKVNKLILEKFKESDAKFDRLLKRQEHPVNLDEKFHDITQEIIVNLNKKFLEAQKLYTTSNEEFDKFAKEVSENIMLAVTKSDVLEKSITKLISAKLDGSEFNITKEINPIKYMIVDENAKMRKEIEALRTKEATVIETKSYFWGLYKTTKTQK